MNRLRKKLSSWKRKRGRGRLSHYRNRKLRSILQGECGGSCRMTQHITPYPNRAGVGERGWHGWETISRQSRTASTHKSQLRMQFAPLLSLAYETALSPCQLPHKGTRETQDMTRQDAMIDFLDCRHEGKKKRIAIFGPSSRCLVVVQVVVVYDPCYGVRSKAARRLLMTSLAGIFLPPQTPWPCGFQEMSKCKVQRPKQPPIP